jgi:hypothetical protein
LFHASQKGSIPTGAHRSFQRVHHRKQKRWTIATGPNRKNLRWARAITQDPTNKKCDVIIFRDPIAFLLDASGSLRSGIAEFCEHRRERQALKQRHVKPSLF